MIDLYKGDCLEVMRTIPDASIDAIITDPPYGTTACKWDSVIDFSLMWEQLNRIIKPNGAIVLFGSEPFSSALRMSNIKNYKYDWIWDKKLGGNSMLVKKQPSRVVENIMVFNKHNYYPQMEERGKPVYKNNKNKATYESANKHNDKAVRVKNNIYYPKSIISIYNNRRGKVHPTQKPVELLEYLIKTYTQENETVLDFTMGSGTTGVAAKNLNRNFIGIEQDEKYFKIAEQRIKETEYKLF
jgi:site-specific DNA-methyltransferase (adenine-specific)